MTSSLKYSALGKENSLAYQVLFSVYMLHNHTHTNYIHLGDTLQAYTESDMLGSQTIRHSQCQLLIPQNPLSQHPKCQACTQHRKSLHAMVSRHQHKLDSDTSSTHPSSHTNYRHLTPAEKDQRLSEMHDELRAIEKKCERLTSKIAEGSKVELDEQSNEDILKVMEERSRQVQEKYSPDSFPSLFWQQQLKAAQSNPKAMRWHPVMIKWCIHLSHYSSSGYEALRQSGCIRLPSQRTIRDYTHFASAAPGFSVDIDKQIIEAAKISTCQEWEKCHFILMDEMYIKEDLVYNKHTGMFNSNSIID